MWEDTQKGSGIERGQRGCGLVGMERGRSMDKGGVAGRGKGREEGDKEGRKRGVAGIPATKEA